MAKCIRRRKQGVIQLNSRVTSIGISNAGKSMEIVTNDIDLHHFSHVISTIPLPVLRIVDTSKAKLTPMQYNAIRTLSYGTSVKIGMQFKTAWWTTGKDRDGNPLNIIGGQTYTDRPIRSIVYPSFGDIQNGKTTTLIAGYCTNEDARRITAMFEKDDTRLISMVLKELAEIHNVTVEFLRGELIDALAWDWSRNPYTMGNNIFPFHLYLLVDPFL